MSDFIVLNGRHHYTGKKTVSVECCGVAFSGVKKGDYFEIAGNMVTHCKHAPWWGCAQKIADLRKEIGNILGGKAGDIEALNKELNECLAEYAKAQNPDIKVL